MTAIIRNPLVVFFGAAMVMLAVTTTPVHAMGEGFGRYYLDRHLAEYWAERHAQHSQAEGSKQTPDDQFAVSESPIVSDADPSTDRNKNWKVNKPDFLDDPQHNRGR
ncbi:MAG: hypothetical protein IID48_18375 [Proteobacteria bacterium]|nr:hypothetical protein [Pseudomonadota bacterium]